MALGVSRRPGEGEDAFLPRLLITGFGPFPGARQNPTETLVRALGREPAATFGASAVRAIVLPTEYRRSWPMLRRIYVSFDPDIVVHFGLSAKARAIHVEGVGRNVAAPEKPDASGYALRSGRARRTGPETIAATLPVTAIVAALRKAGLPAELSDDAGAYVCNATLYRSLLAAERGSRRVGFIHAPPESVLSAAKLREAAAIVLRTAIAAWRKSQKLTL